MVRPLAFVLSSLCSMGLLACSLPVLSPIDPVPTVSVAAGATAHRTLARPSESPLLAEVNRVRQARGLTALRGNLQLDQAAQDYAAVLAAQQRLDHTGPDGSRPAQRAERAGYRWGFIGENLASGQLSAQQTVEDWLDSPAHRDNMLDRRPTEAGVGFVRVADQIAVQPNGDRIIQPGSYWVLLLGLPQE